MFELAPLSFKLCKSAVLPLRGLSRGPMTAEQILSLHSSFNEALKEQGYDALERIYSEQYMLVRPDGSALNKQAVLTDLREQGLKFHSIEIKDAVVRVFGSAAILTAESRTASSRNGRESQAHSRLVAVYAQEGDAIRLVHFQSTILS